MAGFHPSAEGTVGGIGRNRLIGGRSGEQMYAATEHVLRQTIEEDDR